MAGDNIVDLQVGIGADLSQLEADLETAKQKIADISDSKTSKVKIAVTPDVDTKAFINQIQKAVAGQTVKVKVDTTAIQKEIKQKDIPVITPKIDIGDADRKLDNFLNKIKSLREISGAKDVTSKISTDAAGNATSGVLSYTNALGKAQTETYKLVDICDEAGEVISREFQKELTA